MSDEAVALLAGFLLATVATPVGVSGAVFLLPVQLSVLHVPDPRVTPTNLLYNVVSGPGGLLRYRRSVRLDSVLARQIPAAKSAGRRQATLPVPQGVGQHLGQQVAGRTDRKTKIARRVVMAGDQTPQPALAYQ